MKQSLHFPASETDRVEKNKDKNEAALSTNGTKQALELILPLLLNIFFNT